MKYVKHFHILPGILLLFLTDSYAQKNVVDLTGSIIVKMQDDSVVSRYNAKIINQVMSRAKKGGLIIRFPKGITWISAPLSIPSNTTLTGHPGGSTIAISAGMQDVAEGFIVNTNFALHTSVADEYITISNLTINGNRSNEKDPVHARGIYLNKVHHVLISRVKVYNTLAEAIRVDASNLQQTSKYIRIENCSSYRRGTDYPSIMVRSFTEEGKNQANTPSHVTDVTIRNNLSIGGSHGIMLFNINKASILSNTCINNINRGIIIGPTCSNIIIRKNSVDSAGSSGIHLAYFSKNILVDSNTVTNTLDDMSHIGIEGQGIKAYTGFDSITITNNICINNFTDGIALEGGGYGQRFTIAGNTCTGNKRNGIRIWAGKLIFTDGTDIENGLVENNKLIDNVLEPVFIGSDNEGKNRVKKLVVRKNAVRAKNNQNKIKVEYSGAGVKVTEQ